MRTAFINELTLLAQENKNLFLAVGDLGFSVIEKYAEAYPDRYLNAGIAEQNMTGLAAGLASEGYHVFTYSIANFPTFRCLEQIRNDVCYHKLPVTIVAVGGGLGYGTLGYSHHAVQDIAVMRTLPELKVLAPGDPNETRACLSWIVENPCPSYLRLGKAGEPIFSDEELELKSGEMNVYRKPAEDSGSKGLILTTGAALGVAIEAFDKNLLAEHHWTVASLPIWSSLDKDVIVQQLQRYDFIITVENHLLSGGFGSFIKEMVNECETFETKITSLALSSDVCGIVGSESFLSDLGGLTPGDLAEIAMSYYPI